MWRVIVWPVVSVFCLSLACYADTEIRNANLLVRVSEADGSYTIATKGSENPIIRAGVAAEVDHRWIKSADYPKHEISVSNFEDDLGRAQQANVECTGVPDRPDLTYTIRVYDNRPYGELEVQVKNRTGRAIEV